MFPFRRNLKSIKNAMEDLRSFPAPKNIKKVNFKTICIYGEKSEYVNKYSLHQLQRYHMRLFISIIDDFNFLPYNGRLKND